MLVKGAYFRFYFLRVAVISDIYYWLQVYIKVIPDYGCTYYPIDIMGGSYVYCCLGVPVLDITDCLVAVPGTGFPFYLMLLAGADKLLYFISITEQAFRWTYAESRFFEMLKISPFPHSLLPQL